MSRADPLPRGLGAGSRTDGDLDFSQRGTKVIMESKAKPRSFKKDSAGTQRSLRGGRSRMPSVPGQRTPSKGHPLLSQLSYTWNRGGRLRELRIRCLARKFFCLWVKRTFGRVFPWRARHHYETRLLQKTFEEWKEEWWVFRWEWKLRIRADCHYRYSLYNLMFQTWQTYVRQQRDKRNKYHRAEDHAVKQKLRPVWKHWLIYVDVRRIKRGMRTLAQEFRQQSILRVSWRVWLRQVQKIHVGRVMDTLALQHWGVSLQFWAWSQWQQQFQYVQITRKKEAKAAKHRERRELRRCLQAWQGYLQGRREKQRQEQLARGFHRSSVARASFVVWRLAWTQKMHHHARLVQIEALAARMTLRQAFTRWKLYVQLCAAEAVLWHKAEEHHRHQLALSCFQALKENVKNSRLHRLRKNLAHGQQRAVLLQRFWHCWCRRAEQREEERELPQLLHAHSHYREVLLRKCLQLWSQSAQGRRHAQMQNARADHFYQSRNLPAFFQAWRSFSLQRREKRGRREEASSFHRELLKRWAFDTWWRKMGLQREMRLSERMAIVHAEQQVLRQSWCLWRWRTAELLMQRGAQATACAHHRQRQLQRTFRIWKENFESLRARQAGETRAVVFNSRLLVCLTWSKWREYVALQNTKWEKFACADRHYRRLLLRRVLDAWMTYHGRVQGILCQVAEREKGHHQALLRRVLWLWRENAMAQREEARKMLLAENHYRRTILGKVVLQWRDTACLRIYHREQEAQAVAEARKQLERGRLQALFQRWWECSRRSYTQRSLVRRAAQHHGRRLLSTCLAHWKEHHCQCVRKMLLQRQGAQLMAWRLKRSFFSMWKHQLGERQWEQQATARALWLWAFRLQGKVWDAWLGFVLERRRKKARLEEAALVYHGSLVHKGVTHLLRFGAGMKSFRIQLHAQQQAQVAHNLHQVVRRCATLWKHKALAKDRSHFPVATSQRRVKFEVPATDATPAIVREVAMDTKQTRAPWRPSKYWGWSLQMASGDPCLPNLSMVRSERKQPRRPDFLLDSLERTSMTGHPCPGLLAEMAVPSICTQPGPRAAPGAPGPGFRTCPDSGSPLKAPAQPELSLAPRSATAGHQVPRERPAAASAPVAAAARTGRPQPGGRLHLPKDFLGSRRPQQDLEAAGSVPADARRAQGIVEDGELEAELEEIWEKLCSYQAKKHNLRSWQRQASSLRKWVELSLEEPRPEEEAGRRVRQKLEQAEEQIARLVEELQGERQQVQRCMARVRDLRAAFS